MKSQSLIFYFLITLVITSCSKNIHYSSEQIKETSGRYLYNPEEVIDVYYEDNQLYLKWKGSSKIKPVVLDETTFFVPDMYQKLRFAIHPQTKERYLAVVNEDDESKITYDYIKVDDDYMTPWMYVKREDFEKATQAYLALQKKDSTKTYIEEQHINRLGYELLRDKKYEKSIAAFQMNVALYPESDNTYDSLGEAYLRKGDSLQAFDNFKKAFELNSGNKRAKKFMEAYIQQQN